MSRSTLLLLILSFLFLSCKKNDVKEKTTHEECDHDYDTTRIVRSNDERLRNHFLQYEINPKIVINNIDSTQKDISLLEHRIKWINSPKETILNIDNNQISLKNEMTLNEVHNLQKDTLNAAKNWTQIKLYQYGNKDLIAIEMSYLHCDDPSCISSFYLLYDTKSKTTNCFGAFHSNLDMNLYDFGDKKISFISQSHLIYPACDAKIFNLYTINDKGIFQLETKKDGKPYQIEQNYSDQSIKEFEHLNEKDWLKKIK